MNELAKVFNYQAAEVRTFLVDGQPWFVAKDICNILELENVTMAIKKLDNEDKLTSKIFSAGQDREVNFVNESGLYCLIFSSNKPEAQNFKRWVTHEVLPSIRKTGSYSTENIFENPEAIIELAIKYRDAKNKLDTVIKSDGLVPQVSNNNPQQRTYERRTSYERDLKKASIQKAMEMYQDKQYKVCDIIKICNISWNTLYKNLAKIQVS